MQSGVKWDEAVTVISDSAREFVKAVEGSRIARGRILDWFHIAMRVRAVDQSLVSCAREQGPAWPEFRRWIQRVKWSVWHGKGRRAVNALEHIKHELGKWPGHEYRSTLWWNVRKLHGYLSEHSKYLVNYAERDRKGLPISSGIAESAVNQVVSLRMAKKRRMRWSDHGAHALAQVRVAVLNRELSPRSFGASDSTMQDWNVTEPGELLRLAA